MVLNAHYDGLQKVEPMEDGKPSSYNSTEECESFLQATKMMQTPKMKRVVVKR